MPNYTVVFDAKHPPESYVPPVGVAGGIVGEIDTSAYSRLQVPADACKAFKASIADLSNRDQVRGHATRASDRDLGPSR
jgi:hypothetical protein